MKSLLFVDDDPFMIRMAQKVFRFNHFEVSTASNGLQALEALEQLSHAKKLPDLIILDLMMPILDGWSFLKQRSQNPAWLAIPVLVLSAVGELQPVEGDFAGVKAVLTKPTSLEELLKAVQSIFES